MNSYKLIIESIEQDDILKYDKLKYNSNNHWDLDEYGGNPPSDYYEKILASNTKNWIDKFISSYKKFTIDNSIDIKWIKKASIISQQTGKFSKLFEDELDDFVQRFEIDHPEIFDGITPYFVRCENVSLKYGMHGTGPYYNIKQIIESIVSTIRTHTPIYLDTVQIPIYLIPWNPKISDFNEFRVFVSQGKITAISQQAIYNKFDQDCTDDQIKSYVDIIIKYFTQVVSKNIDWTDSYTYDFAIIDKSIPYFIEPNGFGAGYAAGSALFHWIIDRDKLYGLNIDNIDSSNKIYFRYTI